jgi:hypothetical protein
MRTIIMEQTVSLLCKTQEDIDALFKEGYVLKEIKTIKYLVKDEVL